MSIQVHSIEAGLSWCHLIEFESGSVLVDAGSPGKADLITRKIESLAGKPLRLILITHAHMDHYGAAAEIRRRTGAPIAIHRADAESMARGETRVGHVRLWGHLVKWILPIVERVLKPEATAADEPLEDGDALDRFGLNARVVHTPGHTPGSICLILADGQAFVGDLASAMGWPHAQVLYAQDWDGLRASIQHMQSLEPTRVYTGHGGRPIEGPAFLAI